MDRLLERQISAVALILCIAMCVWNMLLHDGPDQFQQCTECPMEGQ